MVATFVTTLDNPFSYFSQFDDWYAFDERHGYCTCGLVDRFAKTSNEMSDKDIAEAINDAVDRIVKLNPLGIYKKIVDDRPKKPENAEKIQENE